MVEKAKEEKRRKVLVTGSAGMLGIDLCKELSDDYDVIGLDIRTQGSKVIRCDITQRDNVIKLIVGAKPDFIIHAAAFTEVDRCEKETDKALHINTESTENVALSALELKIPFIYISTDFVFNGSKKSPYIEEDPTGPINAYGRSKLGGEKKAGALDKYIIIRTSWLYGANGKNFVEAILDFAKTQKERKVVDDQIGTPTYTKDLARAIHKLVDVMKGQESIWGIYHVSNRGAVSWFDYAKEILKISGINNFRLIPVKSDQLARPARRPLFSVLDNSKFEKVTGFVMRPWKEALKEYIDDRSRKKD